VATADDEGNLSANLHAGATVTATLSGVVAAAGHCRVTASVAAEGGVGNLNGRVALGVEYTAAREWCRGLGTTTSAEHEARFRTLLVEVPPASVSVLRCFRGILWPDAPKHCGPPPNPPTVGGRYNRAAEIMMYLSNSELGVSKELEERDGPKWIQEFDIPIAALNVADFVGLPERNFVNHVFFNAERAVWPDTDVPYDFTQRVAELVRERFGGMIVRGARDVYQNIVIFEPGTRWEAWAVAPPRPLPKSPAMASRTFPKVACANSVARLCLTVL
jgi:hypothetical protein